MAVKSANHRESCEREQFSRHVGVNGDDVLDSNRSEKSINITIMCVTSIFLFFFSMLQRFCHKYTSRTVQGSGVTWDTYLNTARS